jgi:hypothetical protein
MTIKSGYRHGWLVALIFLFGVQVVHAVPETVSTRVTDVTPSSFSVVWMTNVPAEPDLEVYTDQTMSTRITEGARVVPMPDASPDLVSAAKANGIMKVRVSGLAANTRYYVRAVTRDPSTPDSIGYSGIQEVKTALAVIPYRAADDGSLAGFANDLLSMKVYLRPGDTSFAVGNLVLLESDGSPYSITAFVGASGTPPEGILDLNNVFGTDLTTLKFQGGEKALLKIYRGGTLATLLHYRRFPTGSTLVSVSEPVQGFFADINLDGKIDDEDFVAFKSQYRSQPADATYNPDYNFFADAAGKVDVQDFARFAREYGRLNVQ